MKSSLDFIFDIFMSDDIVSVKSFLDNRFMFKFIKAFNNGFSFKASRSDDFA